MALSEMMCSLEGEGSVLTIEKVERLRSCLLQLEGVAGHPRLDIEWLRLRCDDTMRRAGEAQRDSLRQLQKEVSQFVEEFPGVIPAVLVADFG
jgi:hypothetical protein